MASKNDKSRNPSDAESLFDVDGPIHDSSNSAGKRGDARDADFSLLDEEEKVTIPINSPSQGSAGGTSDSGSNSDETSRLKAELADTRDKYLRSLAEFENYKKRSLKERSEMLKYQGEKIIADLLPVLDNIELAVSHKETDPENLKRGLELIHKLFVDSLSKWEIRAVSGLGTKYDPNRFEALSRVPVNDAEPGTIINEALKAYFYKDKLLRPGKVVVAADRQADELRAPVVSVDREEGENSETIK